MENRTKLSLYEAVLQSAKKYPNAMAIYYKGTRISFRDFIKKVDRTADILVNQLNIKRNDVVLVAQPNIPEALILIYAINKIGAICNSVHPFTPFNQLKNIFRQTKSKVAFVFEQRVAKEVDKYRDFADKIYVTRVEDSLPIFKKWAYHTFMNRAIRKKLGRYQGKFKGFKYFKDLKPTEKEALTVSNKSEEVSLLLHSGSTTGDPKTICLCDHNLNYFSDQALDILCMEAKDVEKKTFLSFLPSFHGFGFCVTMHAPLTICCGVILMPKFNAVEVSKLIKKFKIVCTGAVPTALETLLKCHKFVNSKHLKNMGVIYCGGDSMSISLEERFNKVMIDGGSSCRVFEGYGLTEGVGAECVNTFKHHKSGSIGYPIRGVEFKIMDENGNDLGISNVGEICIKSEMTMVGYLNNEEATKKAVVDGWLHTGDLGHIDEDGFIFFDQRIKRVVKVSGVGVFPSEIEKLVETVPGVSEVCAIRIPDPKLISAIKVFVVAKYFDEEGMKNEIIETCRKYLIRWAVPKEVEFVKELPRTLLGKVDFKKLQEEEDRKRGIINEK